MMFTAFAKTANAGCPFGYDSPDRVPAGQNPTITGRVAPKGYLEAFADIDLNAVKADLKALFLDSKDWWPADYGTYAPFMIRLAWHSSGSYRVRDGRGGSDGGRQRFDPERSWADNTNLDKARRLLEPIKQKYGVGLSWGDLIVLAGDTAIESMGGPIVGFCGGRIDDSTGFWSERLGPNAVQEEVEPCAEPPCQLQGATEVGLVYVNPEGPLIDGVRKVDPVLSAPNVRDTFARMGMNDTETVALVGGGHAFGKTHGACPAGPGDAPNVDPENPWPGLCGVGNGPDTFTSGFEGPWTSNPIKWDNEYFKNLLEYDWEKYESPGGPYQWQATNDPQRLAPDVTNTQTQMIMMTTADLALRFDDEYKKISEMFLDDEKYLDVQFAEAWYKLMTRDMGPHSRCLGEMVPEPREFQNPLPMPPKKLANFGNVRKMIMEVMTKDMSMMPKYGMYTGADKYGDVVNYGPLFAELAWRCAATHRVTDYTGGCNGARIRLSPQKDWEINSGLDMALSLLEPVKNQFGDALSWADLIVLAGNTALEEAGAPKMPFCGGRSDATMDGNAGVMEPLLTDDMGDSLDDLQESALLLGVSPREWTALMGRRSIGQMHRARRGYMGSVDSTPLMLDNKYYKALIGNMWEKFEVPTTMMKMYKAENMDSYITRSDFLLTLEPSFTAAAQDFATDNDLFLDEFAHAWTKVMNADRFDGPAGNLCEPFRNKEEMKLHKDNDSDDSVLIITVIVLALLFVCSLVYNLMTCFTSPSGADKGVEMSRSKGTTASYDQGQQNSPRGAPRV